MARCGRCGQDLGPDEERRAVACWLGFLGAVAAALFALVVFLRGL